MNQKTLKPRVSSLIKIYIPVMIIILLALYGLFSSRFAWAYVKDQDITQYIVKDVIIVGVWLVLFVVLLIILLKGNYYIVNKDSVIHHQFFSNIEYKFENVIFIDENYTKKHKTLLFYNKKGKALYLVLDNESELLDIFKKNCHNLKNYIEINKK